MHRLPLALFGIATLTLVAVTGLQRLNQFLIVVRPPVHIQPARLERAPLEGCTYGRLNPGRPRAWSATEEAAVYAAIVRAEFLQSITHDGVPQARPTEVLIAPRTVEPLLPPGQKDRWPMTYVCERMFTLRVSTAASFRRANRAPGAPLFRWFSLPVPTRFVEPTKETLKAGGLIRFSRAGFSDDLTQALVVVERLRDGFGEGTYFLLERRGGPWLVMSRVGMWIT